MDLLDGITKLINEHGSAQILRERLLLTENKNVAQEKSIALLESKLKESDDRISALVAQLKVCKDENDKKQKLIEQFQQLPGNPMQAEWTGPSPGDVSGVM